MLNDYSTMFAYLMGIIILFFLGRFFVVPMKFIVKMIFNSVLGGIIIVVINFAGSFFNFNISLNFFTAFIIGALGIPGALSIIILKQIFGI